MCQITVLIILLLLFSKYNSHSIQELDNGPDLLALHSCVICHEIFTTEADLLDHTISLHASSNVERDQTNLILNCEKDSFVGAYSSYVIFNLKI